MRAFIAVSIAVAALPLGGCVAGMAVGAASALASQVAKGPPVDPNIDVAPAAREACTARAAQQGEVHVIDVEDRGPGKAIVWGTVGEGPQRRSFECRWAGKIVGFTVRAIARGR
jgi:hypothetical protein